MQFDQGLPALKHPAVLFGMEIGVRAASVVVQTGKCLVEGRPVTVAGPVMLPVAPSPAVTIVGEPLQLSPDKPAGWGQGTRLRGPNAQDVNARGSLVPGSLVIRTAPDGEMLIPGEDYLLDEPWGHVGIGPHSRVTTEDAVFANYRFSLLRMDTLQVSPDGSVSLKIGMPHISAPLPPEADAGSLALAHIFTPYQAEEVRPDCIYVIAETPAQAVTGTTPGRISRAMAKIRSGDPLKIVCWGDSVTAGGNASRPHLRFTDLFAVGLWERFPEARIEVVNISVGASNSLQWLYPDRYPRLPQGPLNPPRFQRVLDARPDLVTIEFVNDCGLDEPQKFEPVYDDILERISAAGAEIIFITPHFTMPAQIGFTELREPEKRPYVLMLREYAERHGIAVADAAARWEHLWKEGIPYMTLLHNTINHPDDRGHRLFAEELWKCFS